MADLARPHIIIPCARTRDKQAIELVPETQAYVWHVLTADFSSAQSRWNTCVGEEVLKVRRLVGELAEREPGCVIAVAASNDFSAIVASIVAEDGFKGQPGFSLGMLPTLCCRHKYYQRLATAPQMLAGPGLWLEDAAPEPADIVYPVYAKLPLSSFGVGGRMIEAAHELTDYQAEAFALGREMVQHLRGVPEAAFAALPLLRRNGFLLEQPVNLDQVTVLGRCVQGETVCDAVVETVFFPGTRNVQCFRWPARLPAFAEQEVLETARQAVANMGFQHGLWNTEVWWGGDAARPYAEIIEINPRPATYFWQLLWMGARYPLYQVMAEMALGGPGSPPGPLLRTGCIEQRAISTGGEGRAGDLVDFDALRRLEEQGDAMVVYLFNAEDDIKQLSPFPVIVAEVLAWVDV